MRKWWESIRWCFSCVSTNMIISFTPHCFIFFCKSEIFGNFFWEKCFFLFFKVKGSQMKVQKEIGTRQPPPPHPFKITCVPESHPSLTPFLIYQSFVNLIYTYITENAPFCMKQSFKNPYLIYMSFLGFERDFSYSVRLGNPIYILTIKPLSTQKWT